MQIAYPKRFKDIERVDVEFPERDVTIAEYLVLFRDALKKTGIEMQARLPDNLASRSIGNSSSKMSAVDILRKIPSVCADEYVWFLNDNVLYLVSVDEAYQRWREWVEQHLLK